MNYLHDDITILSPDLLPVYSYSPKIRAMRKNHVNLMYYICRILLMLTVWWHL